MNIIPVIDLKDGLVVSAQLGQREKYQPLVSPLCNTSRLQDCIQGFLTVHPFRSFYIADLNAITHSGNNQTLIDKVISENTGIEFWIDNGTTAQQLAKNNSPKYKPVIGSESQKNKYLQKLNYFLNDYILSLDYFPQSGYTGPVELLQTHSLWPEQIIIMTLDRVGKNAGPDFKKLQTFCQQYPEKKFIAAGGIRHQQDLLNLKKIGVNHALVASALHSGLINSEIIRRLSYTD